MIAKSYAQALYALAEEENLTDKVMEQLQILQTAFLEEPRFCPLLSSANLTKEERLSVAENSFRGVVHPYVLNFLKILTERGEAVHFLACCKAFEKQYHKDQGVLRVCALTAVPLTPTQREKLTAKLASITGKRIALDNPVDPACLGGICLDYDGKRLDGTIKTRLDSISAALQNTV